MTTRADDADDGDGRRPGRAAIAGIFQPTPTDRSTANGERRTRHAAARTTTAARGDERAKKTRGRTRRRRRTRSNARSRRTRAQHPRCAPRGAPESRARIDDSRRRATRTARTAPIATARCENVAARSVGEGRGGVRDRGRRSSSRRGWRIARRGQRRSTRCECDRKVGATGKAGMQIGNREWMSGFA